MISFNPGPSQLDEATRAELVELARSDLLSASHRSEAFSAISRSAIDGVHDALGLPRSFQVFYQPSATAAMECLLRNFHPARPFHLVHGAFSKRFCETSRRLGLAVGELTSPGAEPVRWREAGIPEETDFLAVTHNETSTGLMWPSEELSALRAAFPRALLAVDVTSSLGAVELPWDSADAWFASVQKALGLPAGLGLLCVRREALEMRLDSCASVAAWQDLRVMLGKMARWQTLETPNVLAIALLARRLERWRAEEVYPLIERKAGLIHCAELPWRTYVSEPAWRSRTIANLEVEQPERWHERARQAGFILGNGYGDQRVSHLRIANFPATTVRDVARLLEILKNGASTE